MKRYLWLLLILSALASRAMGNQAARGWCESGAQVVITSGLTSTTQVQASYPSCTVTVFTHGGGLATIFADNNSTPTPLANPFTAQVNGQWMFYGINGRYDIQLSGAGFPSPVTYSDVLLSDAALGGIVFGVFTTVPFSATPNFNATSFSIFNITLTGNVTSSTISPPIQNGEVIEINVCQDATGSRTMTFPASFLNTAFFTISSTGNTCTPTTWFYDGANWRPFAGSSGGGTTVIPPSLGGTGTGTPAAHGVAVGEGTSTPFNFVLPTNNGQCLMSAPSNFATTDPSYQTCPTGSGGTSAGPQGTIQEAGASAGTFAVSPILDIGGAGTNIEVNANLTPKGPNPYVDVTAYGVRAMVPTATPAATGITVTINSGSASAAVSTSTCASQAGSVCFVNGDGVVIYGAGTTHSMTAPTGVTVTPSVASAGTGTGNVTNGPTGATTYNYQVIARNKTGGITAASSVATTTTGASSLGRQSVNNSTLTRSGNVVTVTTSSAHGFVVGCTIAGGTPISCGEVYIAQTSDDINWGGWFTVASVPDSTHYTVQTGLNTANGAPTSATGGVSVWFNANHIKWSAVTGAWQYCVYGRTGGSLTWIGCGRPTGTSISDLTFDDFGSTLMGSFTQPGWVPSSPPVSATPNSLVTTISSGAGTTTLTLAAAASNTVTTGTIRFDNEPNILTAANATVPNQNGVLLFPTTNGNQYPMNSFLTLPDNVSVLFSGALYLNDTMQTHFGTFKGDTFSQGWGFTSFGQGANALVGVNEANPGVYVASGGITYWKGLRFDGQGVTNGANPFLADQVSPITFEDCDFISSTASGDYMGVPLILRGTLFGSSYVNLFRNVLIVGGPTQVNGVTATPGFFCNGCGLTNLTNVNMSLRGILVSPVASGPSTFELNTGRQQGGINPTITYFSTFGTNASIIVRNFEQDTMAHSLVNVLGGQGTPSVLIENSGFPQGVAGAVAPLVSGVVASTSAMNESSLAPPSLLISGQNTATDFLSSGFAIDGTINTPTSGLYSAHQFNTGVSIGKAYSLFTASPVPAAPTAAVSSGGGILVGTHTYQVVPVWFNGGEGAVSPSSNSVTTTSGNQTVTVTWTAVTPAPIGYDVYQDGLLVSLGAGNCSTIPQYSAAATSAVITSFSCGSVTTVPSGGAAGMHNGQVWGDFFPNAPNNATNALPSFNSSGKLIATACVPTTAGSLCDFNGTIWALFAGNTTSQAIFEESAAGIPSWVAAPLGSLVGTGQSNTWTTGVQDFSAATALRPKSGLTSAIPATCSASPMDVYIATDSQPGRNWYFCTATNTWTQQVNTGVLGLNTYASSHTLLATESWANFTATATATVPHLLNLNKWVVYNASASSTVTIAPDSGNITLNGVTAATATISAGQGVEVACDLTNCFAWGLGGSGGGSGTVASCTVNGVAYYTAATTVNCAIPPTTPNGVPSTLTSTPSSSVSQPPVLVLPGITGRAVTGTTATDTILSTDCNPNRIEYVGSVAVAVTLPTAITLGVPKCVFKMVNTTSPAQTVTITPTTWTINGNATLALTFGQQLWLYVDPNSATNWVADQTDLFGNVSGGAVPASAKLVGTNSSSQIIVAALSNTHIYVGSAGNLPVDVAASGDVTLANTGAFTIIGANGGTFPASAAVLGTNSSKQPVAATGHGVGLPLQCADSSGSGSAQVCNTTPTFTPVAGDAIIYTTTTANTGAALTVNVNSLGAKSVAKWQITTTLVANDIRANTEVLLIYDGTNWELSSIGNVPSGGGSSALSAITAATTTNTIANANNPQIWNWAQTTDSQAAMKFGETSAATSGTVTGNLANQSEVTISTASASTAVPLNVNQGSVTGTTSIPIAQFQTTWNNASLAGRGLMIQVTDTSHGAGSKLINVFGGASGTTNEFSLDSAGDGVFNGFLLIGSSNGISATAASTVLTFQGGSDNAASIVGGGIFRGADNNSTSASSSSGGATLRGGDEIGSTTNQESAGAVTIRGGNVTLASSTASVGGAVNISGGQCASVASASTCGGQVKVVHSYFSTGTATANDLACITAANTVASCTATGTGQFVGVIDSSSTNVVNVAAIGVGGTHTFNATSATFTNGHFVCQSTVASSGNLVVDSSTACGVGLGVGIYIGATGTQTAPVVLMKTF